MPDTPPPTLRLDVWLDVACLFKTRSEAQKACKLGKVTVNGAAAKPHRDIRVGDELVINRPLGRRQTLTVAALTDRHVSRAQARQLYEDHTPAPSAEEIAIRRQDRVFRAMLTPPTRPDRRARRAILRTKRGDGDGD